MYDHYLDKNIAYAVNGSTISSVGRLLDRKFEPQQGLGAVSLSKALHLYGIVLVTQEKRPGRTEKIVGGILAA